MRSGPVRTGRGLLQDANAAPQIPSENDSSRIPSEALASAVCANGSLNAALVSRRPPQGLVRHSDRGSPYASADHRRVLKRVGVAASMSRKGDCLDNAVAESFFATLKTEAFDDAIPGHHDAATQAIREYIDSYYNTKRRHSFTDFESPIAFELKTQVAALAA
jgi:putative transposase